MIHIKDSRASTAIVTDEDGADFTGLDSEGEVEAKSSCSGGDCNIRTGQEFKNLVGLWKTFRLVVNFSKGECKKNLLEDAKPKFCYNYNLQSIPHNQLIIILYIKYI